jgi:iron complex outermembrane receptor protein
MGETGIQAETMHARIFLAVLLAGVAVCCRAQDAPDKLTSMSIEDLLNVKVTSVSKTEQRLSETASAIYVITQEDIQRSGATNIPDLLRMVPGIDVGQINSNTWAISARGFNGRYANNLVVLLDGRSVYLSTFGGVYWDIFDLPLEDIERIEVIRGPGGSMWGADAVNGVVNIITKAARETKGGMIEAGAGNLQPGFGTVQYGGSAGKKTDYRVYAKFFNDSSLPAAAGGDGGDGWNILRGGFRSDSTLSSRDKLMLQGSYYDGREAQAEPFLPSLESVRQLVPVSYNLSGGFFQGVWDHEFSARSESILEVSYDQYTRNNIVREGAGIANVDFQHHYKWGGRQSIVSGFSFYDSASTTNGSLAVNFNPANLETRLFAVFAQDEIAVDPDRVYVTVGARLEHDYYNGFGLMPTLRAAWKVSGENTVWAAVSRALNTPALNQTTMRVNFAGFPGPNGIPLVAGVVGNPELENEALLDYEIGYRSNLSSGLSLDIAAYYSQYSHVPALVPGNSFFESQPAPAHVVAPITYENPMHGEAHGLEGFANWKVIDRLTLSPGYAFESIDMRLVPGSPASTSLALAEGSSPANSAQFRSHLALPHQMAWELSAYFVGRIADPAVPSYTRLDTGVTWQAGEGLSFAVFGQNLLQNERLEYIDTLGSTQSALVKRGGYAKVIWMF